MLSQNFQTRRHRNYERSILFLPNKTGTLVMLWRPHVPRCVQVKKALKAAGVADGPIKRRPELCMVQLTSKGVDMDVLLVRNEAQCAVQGVDRACEQRDMLVRPLFEMTKQEIREMERLPLDRARERGVAEAMSRYMRRQHTTANQAVRLFKVRHGRWAYGRRACEGHAGGLLGCCLCVAGRRAGSHDTTRTRMGVQHAVT